MQITIGVDPEFALRDKKTGRLVSAHDLVPGTKSSPHPVKSGAIQADGVMVEYNIVPAKTSKQFIKHNLDVMNELNSRLGEAYDFVFEPACFYEPEYFVKTVPDFAKELGCSADFNAWHKGAMNPRPEPPPDKWNMRTCSGHIHIGWTKDADVLDPSHRWDCSAVVKALDLYVLPVLKKLDQDVLRESLYGARGAHRPKPYGVEWRVPSNVWLKYPEIWGWLFEACAFVAKNLDTLVGDAMLAAMPAPPAHMPVLETSMVSTALEFGGVPNPQGKVEKKPTKGIRIAALQGTISYDLDLDLEETGDNNYTTPGRREERTVHVL